ncbi:class I SAM-dependent methyltransferase [Patescibacteria group bacterium]|nr:class I SAM-dependent methyltransferase [Patescibacteria group bacterium]
MSDKVQENITSWKNALLEGYFEKHHCYGPKHVFEPAQAIKDFISRLPRKDRVLEIGIGRGHTILWFKRHFKECYGCDIADTYMLDEMLRNVSLGIVDGTGSLDIYNDDTFDLAYTMNVLHHLEYEQVLRYIEESWRVSRAIYHYLLPGDHMAVRNSGSLDTSYSTDPETLKEDMVAMGIPTDLVLVENNMIHLIAEKP